MSFSTVLVANRGEIAVRIIEACRELNIRSIVVYSEADADMPYLRLADGAVCIGPASPAKSYLNIAAIVSAAELTDTDAIHPGYGFLAEDPHFVEVCEEHDIAFIGPPRRVMELAGDKAAAREAARKAGVPVLPGAMAPEDPEELTELASSIGYPLLVKAVFGGGGRGMRWIRTADELLPAVAAAASEAKAACGSDRLYLEKAVESPRHVEVQILADTHGNMIHLGERECSIQRRHQKLIEEAPAPSLGDAERARLHAAALDAARAIGYTNAGTVEFVVGDDGQFHFIEMNARIQVEHSVSEAVTGINLIKEQIRIASGEPLGLTQDDVQVRGHAIECRLNAEDPQRDFMPTAGTVEIEELPGGFGVRLDTALYHGMTVSPFYDSLIAKLIAWGPTREEARVRMTTALKRFRVSGIATTRSAAERIVADAAFIEGRVTTGSAERILSGGA